MQSPLDLNEVRIFSAVADAGSFSAAARALGVPKSTVSKRVARLEERLGARLLQRTTRSVTLTEIGTLFHARCAPLLVELDQAERLVREAHATPTGLLRVTCPVEFASQMIGPTLVAYTERYPEVTVELVALDRRIDLIDEGFDVAIRPGPLAESSLIARKLGTAPRYLVASPAYLDARGTPRSAKDLTEHDCLTPPRRGAATRWRLRGARAPVAVQGRLAANSHALLRQAALAGLGIARLPAMLCADDLRDGRLRVVLPEHVELASLYALYPSARHLSAKVRAFIELIAEHVAAQEPALRRDDAS